MNNMDDRQMRAALKSMTDWLAHPMELGKAPAEIECAGSFEAYEMTYYIFKYKRESGGEWLVGVSGGYEDGELENCGHTFSEMEVFDEDNAEEQARALVDGVRDYIIKSAEDAENRRDNPGTFVNYILFKDIKWDEEALREELKNAWGIEDEPDEDDDCGDEDEEEEDDETFVISYNGAFIALTLIDAPVPYGEVEASAERNFIWQDGAKQVKKHKQHIIAAVMSDELDPRETGELLVKVVVSCLKLFGGIGVYTGDVVMARDFYLDFAEMLDEGLFPLHNLVWVGLYRGKAGMCGYTGGMINLGYNEIEVIDSDAEPMEIHEFIASVASYVINEDVILGDGETIGFSENQKLPITVGPGEAVEGESVKIEFHGGK